MTNRRVKTSILISGRGTNMVSLIEASLEPGFPAEIIHVISNNPDAKGLERAAEFGIETTAINHRDYKSRKAFDAALHKKLENVGTELICCAGFMRILTPEFAKAWSGRILNIHPSLLPKYKGLDTHARAIEAGDTEHGCTVHHLTEELDSGGIIAQARIEIRSDDDSDTLAARVLAKELEIYPRALREIATDILQLPQ